jgi:predicted dinucleotide-binding enzyme
MTKIAVLGTGNVGQTIAKKLKETGYEVMMGSRTKDNSKMLEFAAGQSGSILTGTYAEAAAFGEIIFNCTNGQGSLPALTQAGAEHLRGKVLIDVSNPLDFSQGMPPTLDPVNTTSLAETIQAHFPETHVVKTLNTMWCGLMVNPALVNQGDHHVFLSGNSAEAKITAKQILQRFGWKEDSMMDLGDISTARGPEMYLPLWLRIWGATKNGTFNIKIVS